MSVKDILAFLQNENAGSQMRLANSLSVRDQLMQQAAARQQAQAAAQAQYESQVPVGTPDGSSVSPETANIKVPKGMGGPELKAFLQAISTQESSGNYQAKGVQTKYGRAYGKYQILDANFVNPGGWDKEALGRDITLSEYLNKPAIQEKIARSKLSQYFRKYGAEGAAKSWYAGEGNANSNSNSPQYGGPSINSYAASVLSHMQKYM